MDFCVFSKCLFLNFYLLEATLRFYPGVWSAMSQVLSKTCEQRINANLFNAALSILFFYPPYSHTKGCEVALSHSPRLSSTRKKRNKITMKIAADTQRTHTQADMRNIFVDLVQGHESSRTWGGVSLRPTQSLNTNRTQELSGTSVSELFFFCLFVCFSFFT